MQNRRRHRVDTGRRMRRPHPLGVTVGGLVLIAGCTLSPSESPGGHDNTASPSAEGTASTATYATAACPNPIFPAAPDLDLGPTFECGYLTVPENRSQTHGRTIRLPVARARATAPAPGSDPILYLAGGPGNTALTSANGLVAAGWNHDRDLIIMDQRGSLKADPHLACPEVDTYYNAAVSLAPTSAQAADQEVAAVTECRRRLASTGVDLAAYNTSENAADVAALRVALHINAWNVYGVSYGTDLALQLLRDHPEGIRSVVLDSVLPPQVNVITDGWPNAAIAYHALFAACTGQPACAAAFPNLEAEFRSLVGALTTQPRTIIATDPRNGAPVNVVFDGFTLANLVLVKIAPGSIAEIPTWVHDLATGTGSLAAAALLTTRPPVGLPAWGLNYGVFCREQAPFTTEQQVTTVARQQFSDFPDPVLARVPQLFTPLQNCQAWQVPAAAAQTRQPVTSDLPVLILTGGLDPITPQSWAAEAASTLSHSRPIRAPSAGHDVIHWETACAVPLMNAFLDSPSTPGDDSCLTGAQPPLFVTH